MKPLSNKEIRQLVEAQPGEVPTTTLLTLAEVPELRNRVHHLTTLVGELRLRLESTRAEVRNLLYENPRAIGKHGRAIIAQLNAELAEQDRKRAAKEGSSDR